MQHVELWLKSLVIAIIGTLAPIREIMIAVIVLVIADLVTGVMVARKRKQPITSAGMRRTISKFMVYEISLICGFLTEIYLIPGAGVPISKIVAATIGAVELKSVLENSGAITGIRFSSLMSRLGSKNQPSNDNGKKRKKS